MRIPSIYRSQQRPLRAIRRELRAWRPLPSVAPKRCFLVFAQGRTGSTLLCRLLGSHSQVRCDDELLKYPLAMPERFVARRARIPEEPVYGFHAKGDQIERVQQRDARAFLLRHKREGWQILHLRRLNLFELALSNQYRRASARHHFERGERLPRVELDVERIFRSIRNRKARAEREALAIEGLADRRITYEDDLVGADAQRSLCEAVFGDLDLLPEPVSTRLVKSVRDPWEQFADFDAVLDRVGEREPRFVEMFLARFPARR